MKFAFCLYRYFPFGGLQRDFLRIAKACIARGHSVDVFTMKWEGPLDPTVPVHLIPVSGWQNHVKCRRFIKKLPTYLDQKRYDAIVGFNKMPNLTIYFAADICYQSKLMQKQYKWYPLLPRHREFMRWERTVFSRQSKTHILSLSSIQENEYRRCYQTPVSRFHALPPGIARDRIRPDNANDIRAAMRHTFHLHDSDFLLLMIGSGFKTKGLDRALSALASLPIPLKQRSFLYVIGDDRDRSFRKQIQKLNLTERVTFLGGREDIPQLLLASDVLIHPAYHETAGAVLLEALAAGLPVITTDICGYAKYIVEANAGKVITSPFQQDELNHALAQILLTDRTLLQQNALRFSKTADIYRMPEYAAELIEKITLERA